jgi:hypothetical protein
MITRRRTPPRAWPATAARILLAAALASLPACSRRLPTAERPLVPLDVRVAFPRSAFAARGNGDAAQHTALATLSALRVSAFERVDERYVLRGEAVAKVGRADTSFSLSLQVPYANRYVVTVEAAGYQCGRISNSENCTMDGVQFYGEAGLDLTFAAPGPVAIELADVVPLATRQTFGDSVLVFQWPTVPFASSYTVTNFDGDSVTVFEPTVRLRASAGSDYRIRTDVYNGIRSAFCEYSQ